MNIAIGILQGTIIFFGFLLAGYSISLALKIWRSEDSAYVSNQKHSKNFKMVLFGRLSAWVTNGERDHQVKAGLAYDERRKKWVSMGALSDEAINRIIK